MKKIFIVFILISIPTLLFSEPDFRKVNWGDSPDYVRSNETASFESSDLSGSIGSIRYSTVISLQDVVLFYYFVQDKLVASAYSIEENLPASGNIYINSFEKFEALLQKIYGEPIVKEIKWLDETLKNNKSDWGLALALEDLNFFTFWITNKTEIEHVLTGDGGMKFYHLIRYRSVELLDLKEQAEAEGL